MPLSPCFFRRRILPSNFPRDEALGDVSRFQIKMSVDRADLAGYVEARDRFFSSDPAHPVTVGEGLVFVVNFLKR